MSSPLLTLPDGYMPPLSLPVLPAHALVNNTGAGCTGQRSSSTARKKMKWIYHPGVDFSDKKSPCTSGGTPVFAAHEGKVVHASNTIAPAYGRTLAIYDDSTGYLTFYAHLQAVQVSVGQSVKQGLQVATLGNTPQPYAGAAHLHFEFSIHNIVCDCSVFIKNFRRNQPDQPFYYRSRAKTANEHSFLAQSHWLTGSVEMSHGKDWLAAPNRAMTHTETNHFVRALRLPFRDYSIEQLQAMAAAPDPKAALSAPTTRQTNLTPVRTPTLQQNSSSSRNPGSASTPSSPDATHAFTPFTPSAKQRTAAQQFLQKRHQTDSARVLNLLDSMNAQAIAPLTRGALLSRIIGETGLKGRLPYQFNNWGGVHYARGLANAKPGPQLDDEGLKTFAHFDSDVACIQWMLNGNFAMVWETAAASPTLSATLLAAAGYGSATTMPYASYEFLKDTSSYRPLMELLGITSAVTSPSDGLLGTLLFAGNVLAHKNRGLGRRLACTNEYAQLASKSQTRSALVLVLNGTDRYWISDVGAQCVRLTPVTASFEQYPRGKVAQQTIKSFADTVEWCDRNIARHQGDIFLYHAGSAPVVSELTSSPDADLSLQAAKQRLIRADLTLLIKRISSMPHMPKWSYDQVAQAVNASTMAVFADQLKVVALQDALNGNAPHPVKPINGLENNQTDPEVHSFTNLIVLDSELITSIKALGADEDLVRRLQASPGSPFAVLAPTTGKSDHGPCAIYIPHPDLITLMARVAANPLSISPSEMADVKQFFAQLKALNV
jgi:murein DD-endopeptidase MepM/ murein hydrolase activator NlpD